MLTQDDQSSIVLTTFTYALSGSLGLLCVLVSLAVLIDTVERRARKRRGYSNRRSGIYAGRVWHARFKPTAHRFSYPTFYCLVDLDEIDTTFPWYMWPVASAHWPALARLRACDHLKPPTDQGDDLNKEPPAQRRRKKASDLAGHIRDMVQEATGKRPTGRIQLLTHLAYLGYCFNPVSFYYCLDDSEKEIEVVVGEVSNTPWGEMHCYVLHPKSNGVEILESGSSSTVRYRFKKIFHVSPFMSMKHIYDWRFSPPIGECGSRLTAQTTLLEPVDRNAEGGMTSKIFFDAKLVMTRREFTAATLCWHMVVFPMYTVWVQVLIHFEAFRLWWKKIPYFPHPTGYETAASRLIGAMMKPLFDAQEAWAAARARRASTSSKSD